MSVITKATVDKIIIISLAHLAMPQKQALHSRRPVFFSEQVHLFFMSFHVVSVIDYAFVPSINLDFAPKNCVLVASL